MSEDFLSLDRNPQLVVVSGDPAHTQAHHSLQAVGWRDIDGLHRQTAECDLLIIGGGGLFHDYWEHAEDLVLTPEHAGLTALESLTTMAMFEEKPYAIYAAGVGPLVRERSRQRTARIFNGSGWASVRDQGSLETLRACDLQDIDRVSVLADPAFSLEPSQEAMDKVGATIRSIMGRSEEPLYGVSLRYWDFNGPISAWTPQVAAGLQAFLDSQAGHLVCFPFQAGGETAYENDVAVTRQVYDQIEPRSRTVLLDAPLAPGETAALISQLDGLLAMRYHAVLFALKAGVPVVGLAYDPKVAHLFDEFGAKVSCLDSGAWTASQVLAALDTTFESDPRAQQAARRTASILARKAQAGMRHLVEQIPNLRVAPAAMAADAARTVAFVKMRQSEKLKAANQALADQAAQLEVQLQSTETQLKNTTSKWEAAQRELDGAEAAYQALLDKLDQAKKELNQAEEELEDFRIIKAGRGWRLLRRLWAIRFWMIPQNSARERLLASLVRGRWLGALRDRLLAWGLPLPMSWYAYVFDRYCRQRAELIPTTDLSRLRGPSQPGLISVILPAYNAQDLVEESVESLLCQTYQDWELIAIDDGSTDGTGRILDRYALQDGRIQVIHQENKKIPKSLSRGVAAARGQFITWTSADNRMKPDCLERLRADLERQPGVDMMFANLDIIDDQGRPLLGSGWFAGYQTPHGSQHIHLPADMRPLNVWPNNYVGAAFLYRDRVAWLLGDYSAKRFTTEDYDYWMRVNALMTLRHADFQVPVYEYRFHDRSLTHQDEALGITSGRKKLMAFEDFRRDFYISPALWWIDGSGDEQVEAIAEAIRGHARAGDQPCPPIQELAQTSAVDLWHPTAYVCLRRSVIEAGEPPTELPTSALSILIVTDPSSVETEAPEGWDMCFVMHAMPEIPALSGKRRGWFAVDDSETLFTSMDIRLRAKHTALIEDSIDTIQDGRIGFSIVVCTFRRRERLEACLHALTQLNTHPSEYEVIVVNNDPSDPFPGQVVERMIRSKYVDWPEHFKLLPCALPGLSSARNVGLGAARGEVVCFIDDDALADSEWLNWIARAFEEHADAAVVGGTIDVPPPDPRPSWLPDRWQSYWSGFEPQADRCVQVEHWWEFPWGANWCVRRKPLREIGGFRTRYGRKGSGFAGGEEIIAGLMIQELGYSIYVEPRARVVHDVERDRFNRSHVWHTVLQGRRTWYKAQRDLYMPREMTFSRLMVRAAKSLLGMPTALLRRPALVVAADVNANLHLVVWYAKDALARIRRA